FVDRVVALVPPRDDVDCFLTRERAGDELEGQWVQDRLVNHDRDVLAGCFGAAVLEVLVHGHTAVWRGVAPALAGPPLEDLLRRRLCRIVRDDHFEVVERLTRKALEAEIEEVGPVPGWNDHAKTGHVGLRWSRHGRWTLRRMIRGAQAWLARPIDEHRDHLARLERRVDAG